MVLARDLHISGVNKTQGRKIFRPNPVGAIPQEEGYLPILDIAKLRPDSVQIIEYKLHKKYLKTRGNNCILLLSTVKQVPLCRVSAEYNSRI